MKCFGRSPFCVLLVGSVPVWILINVASSCARQALITCFAHFCFRWQHGWGWNKEIYKGVLLFSLPSTHILQITPQSADSQHCGCGVIDDLHDVENYSTLPLHIFTQATVSTYFWLETGLKSFMRWVPLLPKSGTHPQVMALQAKDSKNPVAGHPQSSTNDFYALGLADSR